MACLSAASEDDLDEHWTWMSTGSFTQSFTVFSGAATVRDRPGGEVSEGQDDQREVGAVLLHAGRLASVSDLPLRSV